jgi:hypothetical protein
MNSQDMELESSLTRTPIERVYEILRFPEVVQRKGMVVFKLLCYGKNDATVIIQQSLNQLI